MSTVIEKLREARALIEDPAHWCQESYALNAEGEAVQARDIGAVKWCAVGACDFVGGSRDLSECLYKITRGSETSVVHTNDILGHEAVMKLFDAAIARAESQQ